MPWQAFVDFRDFQRLAAAHAQASFAAGKTAQQALAEFRPGEKYSTWRYGQRATTPPTAATGHDHAATPPRPGLPPGIPSAANAPPGGMFATIYAELQPQAAAAPAQ